MWFLRHCTTRIVPAILCGQSRRLKSDESMTMSEYFAFLLPFTIQFILLTSYSHQYDGIWCTYISFTIVDSLNCVRNKTFRLFQCSQNCFTFVPKKDLPLSFIVTWRCREQHHIYDELRNYLMEHKPPPA